MNEHIKDSVQYRNREERFNDVVQSGEESIEACVEKFQGGLEKVVPYLLFVLGVIGIGILLLSGVV